MRVGILGGTFDPVHYGHLLLADACREACQLQQVLWVPAALSPHKRDTRPATAAHRVAMLELAIAGNEFFEVCHLELERGGVSYTVDTLETLSRVRPEDEFFFLMGADALRDFSEWHQPTRICQLALPVVVRRYGSPEPHWKLLKDFLDDARLQAARNLQVQMPRLEFSSREMRQRIATNRSIRYWTPRGVQAYIEAHGLYRHA